MINQRVLKVTPTISSGSAYAIGDSVGGLQTFTDAVSSVGGLLLVTSIVLVEETDGNESPIDVVFFSDNPNDVNTVTADNSAVDINENDADKIAGYIPIQNAEYISLTSCSVASKIEDFIIGLANDTKDLYVLLVTRDAQTYTGTDHLTLIINVQEIA